MKKSMKIINLFLTILLVNAICLGSNFLFTINSAQIFENDEEDNEHINIKYIDINSSIVGNFLEVTTNDDNLEVWKYCIINLKDLRQEQIVTIESANNDSYSKHQVPFFNYVKNDHNAGLNINLVFRDYFHFGEVKETWTFGHANAGSNINFKDLYQDVFLAIGTIKFQWYYNDDNELLIYIISTLYIEPQETFARAVTNLGSVFRVYYEE